MLSIELMEDVDCVLVNIVFDDNYYDKGTDCWLEENNNNVEQFEQGNQIIPPDFQTIKLELLSRTKLVSKEN